MLLCDWAAFAHEVNSLPELRPLYTPPPPSPSSSPAVENYFC